MPNPNAIVGRIVATDPSVEKLNGADFFRRYPNGVSIGFEAGVVARLFPGERSAGMLEILEQLRQMALPVYVEVNPATRAITRLLIPLITRVLNITSAALSGAPPAQPDYSVELEASHARHTLKGGNPDFANLLELLRAALSAKRSLMVTETDDHEIIDVRAAPPDTATPPGPGPEPLKTRESWFHRFCRRWFCFFCCVSGQRATQLFALCAAPSCNPLTVPAPCIPFLYPDDGCWARAHEMCRLMIAAGARPSKVWIDGSLHTLTRNNPNCFVNWGWHVAPTICVRRRFFSSELMVIDPSLFTTPVTEATWKSVQGDPNATLTNTAATVYWRNVIPTDPNYVDTNIRLQFYRLQLKNRSLAFGPPPYANCP
ncbi:MAG TPA: protein-glutamine glutaminase family protein [Candidatus Angelobacter sp.]|nr:protein-glutamine glutaminase family protein [Candidatus Angelobacter sp.]